MTDKIKPLPQLAGVNAYVPGEAFFCREPKRHCLRLSFVTVSPERIETGVAALCRVIAAQLDAGARP